MKNIVITGGAGFVGASLALGLTQALPGLHVTVLDNLKRRGAELNLPRLRDAGIAFVHGDVRCPEDLDATGPANVLIECSAEPSVLAGYGESPRYVLDTNLVGALNCFEYARRHEAGILFLSSSRVYPVAAINGLDFREEPTRFVLEAQQAVPGVSPEGIAETFPLEGTRSLYGATKLSAELVLAEYGAMYGVPAVVNRCGLLSGPWQMGKVDQGVVVLWAARHAYGGKLNYIGFGGAGKQVRDVLHIDDLAALATHEIQHLDQLAGKTFNVGGGAENSVSLSELTELCREATGNTIPVGAVPEDRPADLRWYVTDNAAVTAATGWRPERNVGAVVEDVAAWIAEHRAALEGVLK